jgi:hypothetical protein
MKYKMYLVESAWVPIVSQYKKIDPFSSRPTDYVRCSWDGTFETLEEAEAMYQALRDTDGVIALALIEWESGPVEPKKYEKMHLSHGWRNCCGGMPHERGVRYAERAWGFDRDWTGKIRTAILGEWQEEDVSQEMAEHLHVSAPQPQKLQE